MVSEHGEHRNCHGSSNIGDEFFRFFGKSIIGKITTKQQHISAVRDLSKRVAQGPARMFAIMDISGCGNPECALSHRLKKRNRELGWTFFAELASVLRLGKCTRRRVRLRYDGDDRESRSQKGERQTG